MPAREDEVGVLWEKTSSKGTRYFSGTINGVRVVIFENSNKNSDKAPDWRVYKSLPREE